MISDIAYGWDFADMTHFGKKFQSDVRCLAAGLQKFASALKGREQG
jgi:hypothetical protein